MVDNKSKISLIRHTQKKYITREDLQYNNTHGTHSYNIVMFIPDIFFLYMSFVSVANIFKYENNIY